MFSSELDRVRDPLLTRSWGIVLGTAILIAVAASLVSARTVAVSYWIVAGGFLAAAALRRSPDWSQLPPGPVAFHLAGFLLFALLSTAWAARPGIPLEKACLAMLVAASAWIVAQLMKSETRPNLLHMGEGIWMGLLIGLLYLLVEILTDQSIKLWLFRTIGLGPSDLKPVIFFEWGGNRLLSISRDDLSRNMTSAVLFLWPTILAVRASWARSWRAFGAVFVAALATIVVMMSWHESSKLALLVGLVVFAIANVSLRLVGRLAAIAWIGACLAMPPAALIADRLDLHHASWIQPTARHRIIIWNYTAEKMLTAPLLGVGANMTYVLGPELEADMPEEPGGTLVETLSIHSHSIYLQTWFELGLIGAALLTLFGLSILGAIRSLAPQTQTYAYATFATAAAMASSSYGMWQLWFMASFALSAVLFCIGARIAPAADETVPSQSTG
jgi:hypothetical protein